jgi:hypothetical protein
MCCATFLPLALVDENLETAKIHNVRSFTGVGGRGGQTLAFIHFHQMLGNRSKYSSSSFLPPSPLPSAFSDSTNSMCSIHLTIL